MNTLHNDECIHVEYADKLIEQFEIYMKEAKGKAQPIELALAMALDLSAHVICSIIAQHNKQDNEMAIKQLTKSFNNDLTASVKYHVGGYKKD